MDEVWAYNPGETRMDIACAGHDEVARCRNSFTCRIPARNAHDRYKMGHLTPRGGVERETVGSGTFDAAILRDLRRATLP